MHRALSIKHSIKNNLLYGISLKEPVMCYKGIFKSKPQHPALNLTTLNRWRQSSRGISSPLNTPNGKLVIRVTEEFICQTPAVGQRPQQCFMHGGFNGIWLPYRSRRHYRCSPATQLPAASFLNFIPNNRLWNRLQFNSVYCALSLKQPANCYGKSSLGFPPLRKTRSDNPVVKWSWFGIRMQIF